MARPSAPRPPDRDAALRALVARGVLTEAQLDAVREALSGPGEPVAAPRQRWAELGGYLGGALMLGGAVLLVATSWEDLTRPARITLLAITTAALLVAGVLVAGRPLPATADTVRRRLAAVLLALGSIGAALTAGIAVEGDEFTWAVVVGFAIAAAGYAAVRSLIGVAACAVFSAMAVGAVLADGFDAGPLAITAGFVALGLAWVALAETGVVAPEWAGLAVAEVIALVGAQQAMVNGEHQTWAYGLTAVIAAACFAGYFARRSPVLLVGGVVGVTVAAPEAIWDWTDGAVGGAAAALVAGAVLLVASWLSLRVRRGTG